ncbi:restriction endonuclease subunit S [Bacillus sp. CDB3]|uniref:restriction endonuclease subunit S n=1 Tax=Bacillus sp. CDB3 TaxID=360310 RepID=UPI0010083782|nr:restriction endonuclease subunit S [Bacillus sp. CDB3]
MKSSGKLKNITLKIGSGSTPRGGKSVYLENGPYKLIRSQNVYNHHYTSEGLAYITEEQAEKLKNVSLKEEDILINITGDSVARTTIVQNEMLPARVNQHVSIIRCKENLLDPYYLLAFLTSKDTQNYLLSLAQTGGTRAALTKGMLEQLEIPLASYEVQKKIGNILKTLNEKIIVNNSIIISLENLSQTLFKHWFIDFEFPNAQGVPYKSSGSEMVESELGEIPRGWKTIEFKEIMKISSGKRPKKKVNDIDKENIIPIIGASKLMGFTNEVLYNSPILVIGRVGTHGVVQKLIDPCWPSDNTLVIESELYNFVYEFLRIIDYKSLNRGSTQPLIVQSDIKAQKLAFPINENLVEKFESTLTPLLEKQFLLKKKSKNSKNSVIPFSRNYY